MVEQIEKIDNKGFKFLVFKGFYFSIRESTSVSSHIKIKSFQKDSTLTIFGRDGTRHLFSTIGIYGLTHANVCEN